MDLGQFQVQVREFCDTLHSTCICRLLRTCIFRETSTKVTNNADIFSRWLTRPLCSSSDLSSQQTPFSALFPSSPASFCWLFQLPLSVFLRQLTLCLPWDLPLHFNFLSRGRSRAQGFVWVSRQSRQSDSLTGAHTHTQLNEWPHSVTLIFFSLYREIWIGMCDFLSLRVFGLLSSSLLLFPQRSICPPAFFRYLSNSGTFTELRTRSFIEPTKVVCSDSVSHNRVQVLSILYCYSPLVRIVPATSRWLSP